MSILNVALLSIVLTAANMKTCEQFLDSSCPPSAWPRQGSATSPVLCNGASGKRLGPVKSIQQLEKRLKPFSSGVRLWDDSESTPKETI